MDIGIGLPATIPGVDRDSLLESARRADERGFASVGVIDRIVYPNYEPLIALAAAAAVTERVRLTTAILIAPYRLNTALLAKQVATVDSLSGGRFVLGIAIGARTDDYEASEAPLKGRGARLEQQLDELKRLWSGEERGFAGAVGPSPASEGGPSLIVGGQVDAAFRRAARFGEGWIMGGGTPEDFGAGAAKMREAWSGAGRDGEPRLMALCYFALGDGAAEAADSYLHDYYGFAGEYADQIAAGAATDEETIKRYVSGYADAGCDELICFPCSKDPGQVDLLADAVL
jgi:alkanesulfonate monooxygenase SsuD/methylene tetrahydromethanopterin reductase-like flavin-dependent oxidoreductase (luciferase family)